MFFYLYLLIEFLQKCPNFLNIQILKFYGIHVGPVKKTTRDIYVKKLIEYAGGRRKKNFVHKAIFKKISLKSTTHGILFPLHKFLSNTTPLK